MKPSHHIPSPPKPAPQPPHTVPATVSRLRVYCIDAWSEESTAWRRMSGN
jgi:hypothetical protein